MTSVLFLVQFALTAGFYWSYMHLLKSPRTYTLLLGLAHSMISSQNQLLRPQTSCFHFFLPRYPHIACELLTSEVFAIVEQLSGSEHLMGLLWAFLDSSESLNPLVGRYMCAWSGVHLLLPPLSSLSLPLSLLL